jgi:hypothetical protein
MLSHELLRFFDGAFRRCRRAAPVFGEMTTPITPRFLRIAVANVAAWSSITTSRTSAERRQPAANVPRIETEAEMHDVARIDRNRAAAGAVVVVADERHSVRRPPRYHRHPRRPPELNHLPGGVPNLEPKRFAERQRSSTVAIESCSPP